MSIAKKNKKISNNKTNKTKTNNKTKNTKSNVKSTNKVYKNIGYKLAKKIRINNSKADCKKDTYTKKIIKRYIKNNYIDDLVYDDSANTNVFIILPNQLYDNVKKLKKYEIVYMIEEPIFYYDKEYRPVKPSKIKIAFMRACMKCYEDKLLKAKVNVKYIEYNTIISDGYSFLGDETNITLYDPTDMTVLQKFRDLKLKCTLLSSPNFIMKLNELTEISKHKLISRHSKFYEIVKDKLKILQNVKSTDKENRKEPNNKIVQEVTKKEEKFNEEIIKDKKYDKFYKEACEYTITNFKDHLYIIKDATEYDTLYRNLHKYPINSLLAYKAYDSFLKNRFKSFGDTQDMIIDKCVVVNHSCASACMNIGLLDPNIIVKKIMSYKSKVPMNSLEGLVRQLCWREYCRVIYQYHFNYILGSNVPNNTKPMPKEWYKKFGYEILDNELHKAIETGYAGHITRLMLFLNFFILNEIDPIDIYRWFSTVISIDVYDVYMIFNVYCMGYYYSGAMSRPYLCSSNYLLRMSNYVDDGKWPSHFDKLFKDFIKNKPHEYTFYYKRNTS